MPRLSNSFCRLHKATGRLDAKAKSSGQQGYSIDVRLPGMLTAVIAHPPVFGSKPKSVNDAAAKALAGVKTVLRIPLERGGEGVAVIADGYWPARQGRDALEIDWDTNGVEKVDSEKQLAQYRELAKKPGPHAFEADVSGLSDALHRIEARSRQRSRMRWRRLQGSICGYCHSSWPDRPVFATNYLTV